MKAQSTITPSDRAVPQATDAWVRTDFMGRIHDISTGAAALISMSPAGSYGRQMQLFFVADRQQVIRDMRSARDGMNVDSIRTLKPRERRSIPVRVEMTRDENPDHLLWRLHRDV
jgi:hypothetical protein